MLLDESARAIGTADKLLVHDTCTRLHLAFSCYLFDHDGNVLVTRRALSKATWPGTWTNSFCGHPQPGEAIEDAVRRRGGQELGVALEDLRVVDADFRYRASDSSGIVENEVCPVYRATVSGEISANAHEVMDWTWTHPAALSKATTLTPFAFSPWMVLQMPSLMSTTATGGGGGLANNFRSPGT
ncbi:isopentenyl-diphosphate Delta-isomerase [Rarobacter faecitabidus]